MLFTIGKCRPSAGSATATAFISTNSISRTAKSIRGSEQRYRVWQSASGSARTKLSELRKSRASKSSKEAWCCSWRYWGSLSSDFYRSTWCKQKSGSAGRPPRCCKQRYIAAIRTNQSRSIPAEPWIGGARIRTSGCSDTAVSKYSSARSAATCVKARSATSGNGSSQSVQWGAADDDTKFRLCCAVRALELRTPSARPGTGGCSDAAVPRRGPAGRAVIGVQAKSAGGFSGSVQSIRLGAAVECAHEQCSLSGTVWTFDLGIRRASARRCGNQAVPRRSPAGRAAIRVSAGPASQYPGRRRRGARRRRSAASLGRGDRLYR